MQSLVAFRLSRQHNLTELLLKTPGEGSALLSNLHHISASNPMYTLEMLQRQRVALLAGSPHHLLDHMIHTEIADVFPGFISNCASALSTPSTAGSKDAPIATLNYLRGLVLAMRDNLGVSKLKFKRRAACASFDKIASCASRPFRMPRIASSMPHCAEQFSMSWSGTPVSQRRIYQTCFFSRLQSPFKFCISRFSILRISFYRASSFFGIASKHFYIPYNHPLISLPLTA